MRWFDGDIAQAVTQSRARNAVFVVFVEGKDEVSQKFASAIEDPNVSSKLEGPNFVSIHFESGTQTFNQFSQIYRDPPVPSLYFIGRTGSPIEIVTQTADAQSLMEKILHVESIHLGKPTTSPSNDPKEETPQPSSSAPLEDRIVRAQELLEEKRKKKKMEEEEEARQKELQRRKEGQNVQELQRWQQEQELKRLKEERLRDKRLEQEARQRVLDQIAQNRADKSQASAASAASAASHVPPSTSTPMSSNSNEARLQFRLPDGTTHSNRFEATATLADVRQYIVANIAVPYREFSLATMFPRREFTINDNATSLRDLQLVPSSVVLIIPIGGNSAVQESGPGLFASVQSLLFFMTYPIRQIFTFFRQFLFGGPPAANVSNQTSTPPVQPQNPGSNHQDKRAQRRSGGAYRRAGNSNVHHLHQNHSSSDDENNTWNGNSTQQM